MKKGNNSSGSGIAQIHKLTDDQEILTFRERFSYGLGDLASCIVFMLTMSLSTYFYTNVVGLSAAVVGTIIMISRLFDGISDVVIGVLVDRTKSKHGKARAWILWMTLPYGISAILLFLVPANASSVIQAIYVFITYNLAVTVVYTAINLPYGTLAAMMTRDQNQRSILNIFRMVMANISNLVIAAGTLPLTKLFGDDQAAWIKVSVIYAIIGMLLFLACFLNCRERVKLPATPRGAKLPMKTAFRAMLSNKYWWMISIMYLFWAAYMSQNGTMITYYAQYELGNRDIMSILNIVEKASTIVLILMLAPFVKRIGKRNLSLAGCLVMVAGSALMLTDPQNLTVVMIGVFLKGVGIAPMTATIYSMMADVVEYGNWRTGVRTEGLLYSAATVGYKIGSGLAAAGMGFVLDAAGFDGLSPVTQSVSAHQAISFLFLVVPVAIWVLMTVIMWAYKLDREYPVIMDQLQMNKYSQKAMVQ